MKCGKNLICEVDSSCSVSSFIIKSCAWSDKMRHVCNVHTNLIRTRTSINNMSTANTKLMTCKLHQLNCESNTLTQKRASDIFQGRWYFPPRLTSSSYWCPLLNWLRFKIIMKLRLFSQSIPHSSHSPAISNARRRQYLYIPEDQYCTRQDGAGLNDSPHPSTNHT